jgi:Prolyl oligopeptidase family
MGKFSLIAIVASAIMTVCQGQQNKIKDAGNQSNWHFLKNDTSKLPAATYQSLTQIYDDHSLQNRDVTYRDERLLTMQQTNSIFTMPIYRSKEDWEKRKNELREHILVCAGLWPMPGKNPLNPKYSHRIDHGDYIVETVTLETYPGFFLNGNVYRPKGNGPFPGILAAHGHFEFGRLNNDSVDTEPGRCINFTKQGYVVFIYDMVGYNDTRQVTHFFAGDQISALYGINLLGLQIRNSIRALDYLLSRPEVDSTRIGITGASGGATQNFMLTAVDDRFRVAAPVNMISDNMQGGDLCENAPGLRVNANNMEFGAMIAPKPLLMVSDTHDWTYNTRNTIFPMVKTIFSLYDKDENITNKHFDFIHNYNQASSEAVYEWFGKWLLNDSDVSKFRQQPFIADSDKNLLAFMHERDSDISKSFEQLSPKLFNEPPNKMNEKGLDSLLKNIYVKQLNEYWPKDTSSLHNFYSLYGTAIRHLLGISVPEACDFRILQRTKGKNFIATQLIISVKDKNNWIPCVLYQPLGTANSTVILTGDKGKTQWISSNNSTPDYLINKLIDQNCNVLAPDLFKQGEHVLQSGTTTQRDEKFKYFTTFNLTDRQEQIQDLITLIQWLKKNIEQNPGISIYSVGNSAYTTLLLSSISSDLGNIVIDGNHFDPTNDDHMLSLDIPALMRIGGLKTILAIASNQHLLFYNAHPSFSDASIRSVANLNGNKAHFQITSGSVSLGQTIQFITAGK